MKLDSLIAQIKQAGRKLKAYRYPIAGALIVALFGYTIGIINSELNADRDQASYEAALKEVEKVTFNRDAVETIVDLKDVNIDINAIFDPGRVNPFED